MTKQKILVIGTGGTIGAKAGSTITADAPLKILNLYTPPAGVDLIGRAAFDRFSEHADLAYLEQLCAYMQGIDYSAYRGVVLLHGSDTLTYTAALLAHLLPDKPLVLVAAGTPPEAPGSNARCRLCNRRSSAGHLDKHHPGERLCKIVIDKRAGL